MISIRRRLTRDLGLALAVLLGAGLIAIGAAVTWALSESFDAALRTRGLALDSLTEIEGGKVAFDFSPEVLRNYGGEQPRNYFEIWDSAGTYLTRSPSLEKKDLEPRGFGTPERPRFWSFTLPNGRPGRAIAFVGMPTLIDATPAPAAMRRLQLAVAVDRTEFRETLAGLLGGVAVCGVVLIGAVLLVVPRVLRRGLVPLEQLGDQAAHIDATTLATRFPVADLPAELQPIAQRLNDLLARLEASFERERRFSADLAHELRTPLAELRTLAECALKWPETREATMDRETLAIARQMETMVGHMLALARGEQGQLAVKSEAVAVDRFVADIWRSYGERAAARGLQLEVRLLPAEATADPALLRSILVNLFDNALAYASVRGPVVVATGLEDGRPFVRVANFAENLEAADAPKLFERFWRKEAARSDGQHVGLGLSLARTMATAMNWQLTATIEAEWLTLTLSPRS